MDENAMSEIPAKGESEPRHPQAARPVPLG
jgi:hypothetical protein